MKRPRTIQQATLPTEASEQKAVVAWLKLRGMTGQFTSSVNGAILANAYRQANHLRAMGLSAGFPDLAIYLPPPRCPGKVGTVIEMKRVKGGKLSPEQMAWLNFLDRMSWVSLVCYGADQAIKALLELGY